MIENSKVLKHKQGKYFKGYHPDKNTIKRSHFVSDMACKRRIKYPCHCPKQLCSRSPSPTFSGSNTEDSNFKILCTNTLRERNPRKSPKYIQSETRLFRPICSHEVSVSLHYNIEKHLKYIMGSMIYFCFL